MSGHTVRKRVSASGSSFGKPGDPSHDQPGRPSPPYIMRGLVILQEGFEFTYSHTCISDDVDYICTVSGPEHRLTGHLKGRKSSTSTQYQLANQGAAAFNVVTMATFPCVAPQVPVDSCDHASQDSTPGTALGLKNGYILFLLPSAQFLQASYLSKVASHGQSRYCQR